MTKSVKVTVWRLTNWGDVFDWVKDACQWWSNTALNWKIYLLPHMLTFVLPGWPGSMFLNDGSYYQWTVIIRNTKCLTRNDKQYNSMYDNAKVFDNALLCQNEPRGLKQAGCNSHQRKWTDIFQPHNGSWRVVIPVPLHSTCTQIHMWLTYNWTLSVYHHACTDRLKTECFGWLIAGRGIKTEFIS